MSKKHDIILMKGTMLLCSCGQELRLDGEAAQRTQRTINDMLLDTHAKHKERHK